MQISTLLIIVLILSVPVIAIYKKFDVLFKYIFGKEAKISLLKHNINFAFLSKSLIYLVLVGKLYFSLYMLTYIVTNNVVMSAIGAVIGIAIVISILYIFMKIKPAIQDLIIYLCGNILTTVIFIIFSSVVGLFLFYAVKIIDQKSFVFSLKLISKDLVLALITTIISFSIGKNVSHIIQSTEGCAHRIFNKAFYFIGRIPSIIFGFISYLILNKIDPQFFITSGNIIVKVLICSVFQGVLYSVVLINRTINHRNSTPTKIIDNYKDKFSFFGCFIQIFFEMNLFVQFMFLFVNKGNFFSETYSIALIINSNTFYPICLISFMIYSSYFIWRRVRDS